MNNHNQENFETFLTYIVKYHKKLYNQNRTFQKTLSVVPERELHYSSKSQSHHFSNLFIIFDNENSHLFHHTDLDDIADALIYSTEEAENYRSYCVFCFINGKLINKSEDWEETCIKCAEDIKESQQYYKDITDDFYTSR